MSEQIETGAMDLHQIRWRTVKDASNCTGKKTLMVSLSPSFESFSALRALLQALVDSNDKAVALLAAHEEALMLTVPKIFGKPPKSNGHFYNAKNVGSSVIRRISRESIHLSDAIDDIARLVIELLDINGSSRTLLGAEYLDRPSARVLYRTYQLSHPEKIDWVWGFGHSVFEPDCNLQLGKIARRFYASRNRLFKVLAERMEVSIDPEILNLDIVPFDAPPSMELATVAVSQALVDQNYDRLYLNAAHRGKLDKSDECNVWRMICIADSNLGLIDHALESIRTSLERSDGDPWLSAQSLYMQALLETKRQYNLDAAESLYRQALSLLSECDPEDVRTRIEQAWATNGLALVRTIRSKYLPPEDREKAQLEIFLDEASAFKNVAELDTAHALYLQLNLLANMTLLLEVMGRFEHAVSFWSRVFNKFRGQSSVERRNFEVAFLYRLGLLQYKAGRAADARQSLSRAVQINDSTMSSFAMEHVLFAKGYVELQTGEEVEAAATFVEGCKLSAWLKDNKALSEHLWGLSQAISSESSEVLEYWRSYAEAHGIQTPEGPVLPAPKLPSYVPLIDLEVAPKIDLNRYLTDDRSVRPLDAVVVGRS